MKTIAIAFCLILVALSCIVSVKPVTAETTTVSVDPTNLNLATAHVGQTIQVNINVTNVQNLWGWSLQNVKFNPKVLNITNVQEGSFLKNKATTFFLWTSESHLAFSEGYIPNIEDAFAENTTIDGSGVLATLTFRVISSGSSPVTFNVTRLFNNHEYTPNETETGVNQQIPCTTVNGNVDISQILSGPPPSSAPATTPPDVDSNANGGTNIIIYGIVAAVIICALVTAVVAQKRKRHKRYKVHLSKTRLSTRMLQFS